MWSLQEAAHKLRQVQDLPYGETRTATSEWIVRKLEAEGPQEKLPEAMLHLVEAYFFGTKTPNLFAAFSRVLRLWDEHPEHFDEYDQHNLFWEYKWVADALTSYHQISKEQARAFLDDMRRRFLLAGHTTAAVDEAEFDWAFHVGDFEEADRWKAAWLAHGDDPMSCSSCRTSSIAAYLIAQGLHEEALALGMPTDFNCNRQPSRALRLRSLSYLELGRGQEAQQCLTEAIASKDLAFFNVVDLAAEFEILARGGQIERGLRMLRDKGSKGFKGEGSPGENLSWLLSLIAGLSAAMDQPDLRISGGTTVAHMRAEAISKAEPLVAAFDRRAGTDYQSKRLAHSLEARVTALFPCEKINEVSLSKQDEKVSEETYPGAERKETTSQHDDSLSRQRVMPSEEASPLASLSATPDSPSGDSAPYHDYMPSHGEHDHEECYQRADHYVSRKEYAQAARWYALAARGREEVGLLADSGIAWADCAQSYASMEEYSKACETFLYAWDLLIAGGSSTDVLVSVLREWGVSAEQVNRVVELQGATLALEKIFLKQGKDFSAFSDSFAEEQKDGADAGPLFFSTLKSRKNTKENRTPLEVNEEQVYASFLEINARVLAASVSAESQDFKKSYTEAIGLALRAGELFAELNSFHAAGKAFELAGDLQRMCGAIERALWAYQVAIEAFTLAHERKSQTKTLDSYIQLLRASGQDARVDEVLSRFLK